MGEQQVRRLAALDAEKDGGRSPTGSAAFAGNTRCSDDLQAFIERLAMNEVAVSFLKTQLDDIRRSRRDSPRTSRRDSPRDLARSGDGRFAAVAASSAATVERGC